MKEINQLYNRVWEKERFINWSRFYQTARLIPPSTLQQQIFDIASGPGYFMDYLVSQNIYHQSQLTGFDISTQAVTALQQHYQAHVLDIEKQSTPKPADLIFFLEAIEHVLEPDKVLTNLYNALKPGGYLIISTPNYAKINLRLKMFGGVIPERYTSRNHHISLFSVWFLKERLQANGFVIDQENNLFQMESLGRIFKWIKPFLPNHTTLFPYTDFNYIRCPFCQTCLPIWF